MKLYKKIMSLSMVALASASILSQSVMAQTMIGTHTVQVGEYLFDIALKYGVTVDQMKAWNGLTSDWINVGDVLAIYDSSSTYTPYTSTVATSTTGYHTVAPGDTLSGIAAVYGVSEYDLWAWNGLSSDWLNVGDVLSVSGYATAPVSSSYAAPAVAAATPITTGETTTYTVKAGDSLWAIAEAHGMTYDELLALNGYASTFLQVGDVLTVKASSANSSASDDNSQSIAPLSQADKEDGIKARHKVVAGDNLWRIANKYGVTVHNVKVWNNLTDDSVINEGDELVIKNSVYEAKKHKVTAEDTLESIAEQYKTTTEKLTEWNSLTGTELEVDKELLVSDPNTKIHEVKTGETLDKIAEQYHVTVEELREWNELPEATVVVNGSLIVSDPTGMKETVNTIEATEAVETTEAMETTTVAE
ncbi:MULTISPECIES: LysM peptidoglycan-binding domain-containing protein [unclassified Facklamia]|uniref:LysM peptidoglycan-binding domain-containing protein n=1 Tax=Aerococcaceae TaxID=186827 RepID=UPI0013BAA008|nr:MULTISPECIES: LysM peptidoglycan-binding domain-containing protein [unclassified Facklamia]MBS4461378.1 LysM peptidoglycan-binding domain-containing protein [Aerococcaceae bacterium zg-B36]NEW64148.1 LysM peptidoglycan-binding domain-containing protein [Facklamia sp. 252]NEW67605.1 LysM peptidoglycan-binding domain-containing protein [Facklamia sp. 253]QQD65854.1 LysM peptidoglycan-binding domain-containing protein [Aerococcaceae bacterium zg-252]